MVDELTDALRAADAAVVVATHDRRLQRDLRAWPQLELAVGGPGLAWSDAGSGA